MSQVLSKFVKNLIVWSIKFHCEFILILKQKQLLSDGYYYS